MVKRHPWAFQVVESLLHILSNSYSIISVYTYNALEAVITIFLMVAIKRKCHQMKYNLSLSHIGNKSRHKNKTDFIENFLISTQVLI